MTFTFSDTYETNYLELGMCNICAERLTTSKCSHPDTMEEQKWLAAYICSSYDQTDGIIEEMKLEEPHAIDEAYRMEHQDWLDEQEARESVRPL